MGRLIRRMIQRKWDGNTQRDAIRLDSQTPPQGVEVWEGLPYEEDGHPMHTLNLYRPAGVYGPLPTVVDIHGGGWMYGDRQLNRNYCMYLASRGYAVMGMSYRLVPEVTVAGQVQDVFASLHWLAEHSTEYGFDLSRVLLTGDSAGGHLTGSPPASSSAPTFRSSIRSIPSPSLSPPWPSPTGCATCTASACSPPCWTGLSPGSIST